MSEDESVELVLEVDTFNGPERLEVQLRFGHHWSDLLIFLAEAISPRRKSPLRRMDDGSGVQFFPDQLVQYMLWVQEKRSRPDALLEEFDSQMFAEISDAFVDGLLGKATASSESSASSNERTSSDGSPEA